MSEERILAETEKEGKGGWRCMGYGLGLGLMHREYNEESVKAKRLDKKREENIISMR